MKLADLHSSITSSFYYLMCQPNLMHIMRKIDDLTLEKYIKILCVSTIQELIENRLIHKDVIDKTNNIEKMSSVDFCTIAMDILSPKPIEASIFEALNITSVVKYTLIGFLHDKYLERYTNATNKLKQVTCEINELVALMESSQPNTRNESNESNESNLTQIEELLVKKTQITKILLIDFFVESITEINLVVINNILELIGINFKNATQNNSAIDVSKIITDFDRQLS